MLALVVVLAQGPRLVELRPGMVITQSIVVAPKTYRFPGGGPPITIRGDNISVDFRGATLEGSDPHTAPDQARDTAIVIDGGNTVVVANAHIHGYKIGILARRTHGLALLGNDASHNWKPRLFSLVEHESLVDWLSFHHNEKDEWLRFGAAIYLQDVSGAAVRNNIAVGGMNGLMLVRSTGVTIRDNNFSFNSGLGIGLYRSSDDTIVHNRLDYNVRGYSHGHYTRGQDSADLLLFEQSSRNFVAYNSMTHGGDGIFLWAGQTTMDSGTGGANDNLFYGNDVSYATANGVEATFSRNKVLANRAWGSEYGVWAGYGYETEIRGNDFKGNRTGVAIEHGQDNAIVGNRFDHDSTAIRLWADSIESSDWGYPKHHDTRSRDYHISENDFLGNRTRLNVRNTSGLDTTSTILHQPPPSFITNLMRDSVTVPSSDLSGRDRSAIIVDEWGPYDWQAPMLWPLDSTHAFPLRLVVLGPRSYVRWRLMATRGVKGVYLHGEPVSGGLVGDTIAVAPWDSTHWQVTLGSRGRRFAYGRFEPRIDWTVRMLDSTRVLTRLDLMWYRPPRSYAFLPQANWSLDARGTVTLEKGTYSVRTISDDAVRVWIDSVLVIDDWTPHESQVDYAPLAAGKHDLRVEYRQLDGWVELRVDIIRGSARSAGSPGPH
ncbi:MAG TPA: right-handed parallel beta-helix repeat-containing protein [Gemmatimonadales bacterium]|nr:right-handed parallel beta-helix repeat-containing protein [Gemmatimonadales bacterium]